MATSKLGKVIVDAKGMTVYYFTPDTAGSGKSACSGKCLTAWPAVVPSATVPTATGVSAKLGAITRDDGTKQATVDGRPVYTFAFDKAPGDVTGQGDKGVWWVISPDGAQIGG
ncbi:putative lipoprotein with Yx(FWY)xxD motif [Nakamurella sp. UYEF19]|uniref:COG4315 family predicted lipoprotein n=1 Tax=Nakamurella sp. UYEF19 TaxID=1756392 RepID=UPI0033926E03